MFFYLDTYFISTIDELNIPRIQRHSKSNPIIVPHGHLPCLAYFRRYFMYYQYNNESTGCSRADFQDISMVYNDGDADNYINDKEEGDSVDSNSIFVYMCPFEKLKKNGIEINDDAGKKWNELAMKFDKVENEEDTDAWCPVTKTWKDSCDCNDCLENPPVKKLVHRDVIKEMYKMLNLSITIEYSYSFAEYAGACIKDRLFFCEDCCDFFKCKSHCLRKCSMVSGK